jgi:NAD(P)-dependent dehydrogenase (short-subunit alcohol dehydrogenase family)
MPDAAPFSIPQPQPFDQLLALKGRVAIVTGGTRGLGEAMVKRLAQAGASVVVTARGKPALDQIEEEVGAMGGTAVGLQADAASLDDGKRVIDTTISRFGKVDILVNNAAVFPGSLSIEISEKLWDETVDTDLKGAFFLSKFAAVEMIKAGHGGKIINVLSTDFFRPTGFLAAYGAAKGGLLAVTKAMAKELSPYGIQVNAVIPGATMTQERIDAIKSGKVQGPFQAVPNDAPKTQEMQRKLFEHGNFAQTLAGRLPMHRPGWPDDLAKAVLFLASDLSSYVNGTSLLVDGAQSLV